MSVELTHASFFSGAGGLDLGLERAGWRTVSFSEIDPYASAVLAERWPGVPNLGSIVDIRSDDITRPSAASDAGTAAEGRDGQDGGRGLGTSGARWWEATLYTGGFPCQDLSVAGKRRGLGIDYSLDPNDDPDHGLPWQQSINTRSGLAFAFLGLVERHRPPAVLLENVPGLLSSHGGRDLGALLGTLGELGYGWAYRVLDARHFGVPQRRRRVFILGIHARIDPSGERAAEVLSVGSRCRWHPPAGIEAGPGAAVGLGVSLAHALTASRTRSGRFDPNGETFVHPGTRPPDDAGGQAGRRQGAAPVGGPEPHAGDGERPDAVRRAIRPAADADRDGAPDGLARRLDDRADVELLPLGLDSHRYRCCGNGVVSSVSEWIGVRLAEALTLEMQEVA